MVKKLTWERGETGIYIPRPMAVDVLTTSRYLWSLQDQGEELSRCLFCILGILGTIGVNINK